MSSDSSSVSPVTGSAGNILVSQSFSMDEYQTLVGSVSGPGASSTKTAAVPGIGLSALKTCVSSSMIAQSIYYMKHGTSVMLRKVIAAAVQRGRIRHPRVFGKQRQEQRQEQRQD